MTNVTIDIGNTIISFCMFEKNKLLKHKKIPKDKLDIKVLKFIRSRFFKNQKVKLLISSVVPSSEKIITSFLKDNLINSYSLKDLLKKIDIKTNIKKQNEIGDDRFANIIYAKKIYKNSVIVVDFGTATTFDILNRKGVYFGGIITPGIDLSLNVLRYKTAKLPLVKFKKTVKFCVLFILDFLLCSKFVKIGNIDGTEERNQLSFQNCLEKHIEGILRGKLERA